MVSNNSLSHFLLNFLCGRKFLLISPLYHDRINILVKAFSDSFSVAFFVFVYSRLPYIRFHCGVLELGLPSRFLISFLSLLLRPQLLILRAHWDQDFLYMIAKLNRFFYRDLFIVYDSFDFLVFSLQDKYSSRFDRLITSELKLLAAANLIVARDLRVNIFKNSLSLRRKSILFLPEYIISSISTKASDSSLVPEKLPIELVYVGNIDNDINSNNSWHLHLSQLLNSKYINLHVYNSFFSNHTVLLDLIAKLQLQDVLFSYPPVSPRLLSRVISKHDIGLMLTKVDNKIPHETYTDFSYKRSLGSKVFAYIEAGLPVICETNTFTSYVIRRIRYGCSVSSLSEVPSTVFQVQANKYFINADTIRMTYDYNSSAIREKIRSSVLPFG